MTANRNGNAAGKVCSEGEWVGVNCYQISRIVSSCLSRSKFNKRKLCTRRRKSCFFIHTGWWEISLISCIFSETCNLITYSLLSRLLNYGKGSWVSTRKSSAILMIFFFPVFPGRWNWYLMGQCKYFHVHTYLLFMY